MLRWVVMRHARAPQAMDSRRDHERPLDQRGQREAAVIGAMLASRGWWPDRVLSSDAVRTRETWAAAAPAGPPAEASYLSAFYESGAVAALEAAQSLPPSVTTLLTLGHNPEWERLVGLLTREFVVLGTAHTALLSCAKARWDDAVVPGLWQLEEILQPTDPSD